MSILYERKLQDHLTTHNDVKYTYNSQNICEEVLQLHFKQMMEVILSQMFDVTTCGL